MARIKISDLPKDMKISKDEMKRVLGGGSTLPVPDMPYFRYCPPIPPRRFGMALGRLFIDTVPLPE